MPVLRKLDLASALDTDASIATWTYLAKIPTIPTLEVFELTYCEMHLSDFTSFVLRNIATLKTLVITQVGLYDCNFAAFRKFYAELSQAPRLEDFNQSGLGWGGYDKDHWIQWPRHLCLPNSPDDEDEDGFVHVWIWWYWIHWKGREDIKRVLTELSVCTWTQ